MRRDEEIVLIKVALYFAVGFVMGIVFYLIQEYFI